ncbi:hypothetical protein HK100_000318 [Physocladia obscura]|uniref:Uncharacterized protein n=1 Tax=Physocladia obscura TaxID=109957 RepID=A0AAD5T0C7_9FUNG|nr:hypothetical protein HK100_000318 [Physocladia obscura]
MYVHLIGTEAIAKTSTEATGARSREAIEAKTGMSFHCQITLSLDSAAKIHFFDRSGCRIAASATKGSAIQNLRLGLFEAFALTHNNEFAHAWIDTNNDNNKNNNNNSNIWHDWTGFETTKNMRLLNNGHQTVTSIVAAADPNSVIGSCGWVFFLAENGVLFCMIDASDDPAVRWTSCFQIGPRSLRFASLTNAFEYDEKLHLFGIGPDGVVYGVRQVVSQSREFKQISKIEGGLHLGLHSLVVFAHNSGNKSVHFFAISSDSKLYHAYWSLPDEWCPWYGFEMPQCCKKIAVCEDDGGNMNLFVLDSVGDIHVSCMADKNRVWQNVFDPKKFKASDFAVCSNRDSGAIAVVFVSSDLRGWWVSGRNLNTFVAPKEFSCEGMEILSLLAIVVGDNRTVQMFGISKDLTI